jgi:eukaryotic-like serine/threonine-protein kinase
VVETLEHPRPAGGRPQLVLGRYRLARRLGAGGFGTVWLAHDERLDRPVAVKRVPVDGGHSARAEREALAAARLAHPGIVALYEAGSDDEAVYLVSELVRGQTLGELMRAGELSDRDVLRVGVALCDALEHAHGRGVIHRDVKPGNVLIPDEPTEGAGVAKLTDFGIARMVGDDALTMTGDVIGTLAYMAPEQAEGKRVTEQADLYALALVLYEALSGVNPVRGAGAASTARRLGARLPALQRQRRDLPPDLCAAVDAAVLPRPEQRGTLGDLRDALAGALPEVGDEEGTIAGSPVEGLPDRELGGDELPAGPRGRLRASPAARVVAGAAAGALVALALGTLAPEPPLTPLAGGAGTALAVALLPRLGWLAAAALVVGWVGSPPANRPGTAFVLVAALLPAAILLRRRPAAWSLAAAAPLLGAAYLAGAWPALAAQARGPLRRAALGALGFWWLAVAEALTGDRLLAGPPAGVPPRTGWEGDLAAAANHALAPLVTAGTLAIAGVWALAALVLPVLVRGRSPAVDLVAAAAWAAGLASATEAIAGAAGAGAPRGLVAGAIVSALVAVGARAARGRA